jgi:hypothetical protein
LTISCGLLEKKLPATCTKKNKSWNEFRSRDLAVFNGLWGQDHFLELQILKVKAALPHDKISVFEFGTGYGLVLTNLLKIFNDLEATGLNKSRDNLICINDDFIKAAKQYGIYQEKQEIPSQRIPRLVWGDAEKVGLSLVNDKSFNIIISQFSVQYLLRKDLFLGDLLNKLKVGGTAYLHIYGLKFINSKGLRASASEVTDHFKRHGVELILKKYDVSQGIDVNAGILVGSFSVNASYTPALLGLEFVSELSGGKMGDGGVKSVVRLIQ